MIRCIALYDGYQINIFSTDTGIEYEIKNNYGRNIGTNGNSNITLIGCNACYLLYSAVIVRATMQRL